jgi:hypothetical protein
VKSWQVVALVVLVLALVGASAVLAWSSRQERGALREELAKLRTEVGALQAGQENPRASAELAALRTEVGALRTDRDGLRADRDGLRASLDALQQNLRRVEESALRAARPGGGGGGGRVAVAMADVPAAVRTAAEKALPGAVLGEPTQRTRGGEATYRLKGRLDGQEYDLDFRPDGGLIEAEMPLARMPEVVQQAPAKALPGFKPKDGKRVMLDGKEVYQIDGHTADGECEVFVSPAGEVLKTRMAGGRRGGAAPPAVPAPAPKPGAKETF